MSHTEADQPGQSEQPAAVGERLTAVETEQKRQGGILDQILQRLPGQSASGQAGRGQGQAPAAPNDKPIAELVREGVEQLRREEQDQADRDAEKAQRADHDARLAALEERPPSETAATPAGRIRSAVQRWGFGVDQPHK